MLRVTHNRSEPLRRPMRRLCCVMLCLLLSASIAAAAETIIVGHDGTDGGDAFLIHPPGRIIWAYDLPIGHHLTLEQMVVQYYATSQAEAGCMAIHLWVRRPDGFYTSPWWRYAEWVQPGGDRWGIVASRPDFWNAQVHAPRFTLWGPLRVEVQAVNCTSTARELYFAAMWTLGP